jgi:hypothetical protein
MIFEIDYEVILKIVEKSITDYLGFDIKNLYKHDHIDYAYIFGGAIRDSIVGDPINDVDILCLPQSGAIVETYLQKNGYIKTPLMKKDLNQMYNCKLIFEPHTYIKRDRIVQLIRPVGSQNEDLIRTFFNILTNVDLSSSGLYYDRFGVKESITQSLRDVVSKAFRSFPNNQMYDNDRIYQRKRNLIERGWIDIKDAEEEEFNGRLKRNILTLNRKYNINELIK